MARLADLVVLDAIEVGPAIVEKRRIRVPYRVGTDTTTLTFRYAEDVFDPADRAAHNLAAFIGAQVVLNYGLFARRIVVRGPLDGADRAFLAEHLENTSREIAANKLYGGHNVFL